MTKTNKKSPDKVGCFLKAATYVMFIQTSEKEGIKTFGEKYIADIFKYYKQLDHRAMPEKPGSGHVDPDKITKNENKSALEAVNLIKAKSDGIKKECKCAN